MQELQELVSLLQHHGAIPNHLRQDGGRVATKQDKFLSGIISGKYPSDEEMAWYLYGSANLSPEYRKLKSKFKDRLLDSLLNIDYTKKGKLTDYQKAYYDCHRRWLVFRILVAQQASTSAISLANKLLRQAEKYDFTFICVDLTSYLRLQYSFRESNSRRFEEINQLFHNYNEVLQAEALAEELYANLIVSFANKRMAKDRVAKKASEYGERLKEPLGRYQSYRLQIYGYLIHLIRWEYSNNPVRQLEVCKEAIIHFESKPYQAQNPLQIFYFYKLTCHIYLRQFTEGKETGEYCLSLQKEGSFNWFKCCELLVYLFFQSGHYEEAPALVSRVLRHKEFNSLPENAKEIWKIFEAYLFFLHHLQVTPCVEGRKFKLARFINETPLSFKDKKGMNVNILIIRFLLLLQGKQLGQLVDEIEAMQQYIYRHLRSRQTLRSRNFLKMLILIPRHMFDPEVVNDHAGKYLEKLEEYPVQTFGLPWETEIIPFGQLWALALSCINQRGIKGNSLSRSTLSVQ